MRLFTCLLIPALWLTACSHTYYVIRHAEKQVVGGNQDKMMNNDPPLTAQGLQRALNLADVLKEEKIAYVFSTNTVRTKSTAQPTATRANVTIQLYGPRPDSLFMKRLRGLTKNTLIVGHSNTVGDIVNGLCHATKINGDLPDDEYDNLFVIKYTRFLGTHIKFERRKYSVK